MSHCCFFGLQRFFGMQRLAPKNAWRPRQPDSLIWSPCPRASPAMPTQRRRPKNWWSRQGRFFFGWQPPRKTKFWISIKRFWNSGMLFWFKLIMGLGCFLFGLYFNDSLVRWSWGDPTEQTMVALVTQFTWLKTRMDIYIYTYTLIAKL